MDGTWDIEVRDNAARNNGGYGIAVSGAHGGTIQENTAAGNARPEQIKVAAQ